VALRFYAAPPQNWGFLVLFLRIFGVAFVRALENSPSLLSGHFRQHSSVMEPRDLVSISEPVFLSRGL